MGMLIKLRNRAQITLPKEIVKALGLKSGDDLEIRIEKGRVIITPVAVIPKDELWAWKTEIRTAIEEGREEAREGKLKVYNTVHEMWAEIEAEEK
jgi:AbrB family looped-hinge helix DNA binding protein